jgi:hypothetical protein
LELSHPEVHLVVLSKQKTGVVPASRPCPLWQLAVDVDVGEHAVPVRVVGTDTPQIAKRLREGEEKHSSEESGRQRLHWEAMKRVIAVKIVYKCIVSVKYREEMQLHAVRS